MHQLKAKIVYNRLIKDNYFLLGLDAKKIAQEAKPGQFIHVRVSDKADPLLRRPFSIHRVKPNLEIVYEIKGKGTEVLSRKKPAEKLDIIGPLGNGFSILDTRSSIFVAGGMGVAPLLFLAEKLKKFGVRGSEFVVLIGSKNKNKVMCAKEFKKLGCKVDIATEDGSLGKKGLITDLLKGLLRTMNSKLRTQIYACGPKPMLAQVAKIAKKYKTPAQVSLEEFMGCGIGACLGCVIKTKSGYKRVCKDGPVFDAQEIVWT